MYTVKKVFNNNIALVEDDFHDEFILLGNGLAFQKKGGDVIDASKIDKKFSLDAEAFTQKFSQLFSEIPIVYIELAMHVIENAEKALNVEFNEMIYIGLSDHLRYAIERAKERLDMPNVMLWEIRRFYPKEYAAALKAIEQIYYYENVWLSDNEAGYIALHFVNAQIDSPKMSLTIELTTIIMDIMKIVQLQFKIEIDQSSLSYTRFATHISYFVRRLMQGELSESDDSFIFEQMVQKYPDTFRCALQIETYLNVKAGVRLTKEEIVYFMIHINRVVEQSIEKKEKIYEL
ncbi:hypothetical protein AOC36_03725 [Erysipelothrix larvae]|uniref:PRD domain-containing protein n=1 Tax=Erysipelothrix larvae TaxID=1514105 RepID=A0A0X8GZ64_9FIRM|nr:PRD domain-containing protein [Erysipelothrix larvae]AMC93112.1 hypothetical protein AOC36_03725 [Erysipelothrix larvae]